MNLEQVKELLKLIAADSCTKADRETFTHWLAHATKDDYQEMLAVWETLLEEQSDHSSKYHNLISRIEESIDKTETPVVPLYRKKEVKHFLLNWKVVAASVIVIVACGVSLYYSGKNSFNSTVSNVAKNDIKPGGNNAVLILADGSKVDLNGIANGEVASQAGIKIVKSAGGQLIYTVVKNGEPANLGLFNTIKTPIGGQYRVNLPDGSRIWLNAASSLRYPVTFGSDERRVELVGEAYFEIAKDKTKPFLVVSNRQTVEVLGTHFNVNSYEDEDNTKTTLLEGSVKVFTAVNRKNIILNPGQQSQVNAGGINVKDVDASDAAAWKDGYFVFNAETIPSAMRKIARWYGLEVSYEGDINDKDLAGSTSRSTNVSEVLKTLELTGLVHFKLDGRKIKVIAN
jgi:transmembrane sensor